MKKYLRSVITNRHTGLVIQQMPTGYGKTYEIADCIRELAMNPDENRKIIYLTTMNKNLPDELISKLYGENQDLFNRQVLRIRANLDEVMEKILDLEIPDEFQTDSYEKLCGAVRIYKNAQDIRIKDKQYLEELRKNADGKERLFRKELTKRLAREFTSKETRLNAIMADRRFSWIGALYPAVFTDQRQVLLMSISKFLRKNATIIEPSYDFLKADFLDNAIVFIDEFDAAKGVILSEIISKSLDMKNDYISLFRHINMTFVPEHLSADLMNAANAVHGNNSLQSLLNEAREIEDNYHLNLSYKVAEASISRSQNFLLKDATFHTVLQAGAKYVRTNVDEDNNRVQIHFEGKEQFYKERKENDIVIYSMLRDVSTYLQHFRFFLLSWAEEYRKSTNANRRADSSMRDEMSIESALTTILARLELSRNQQEIILGELCGSKVRVDNNEILPDNSFYQRGMEIFAFEDADEHNDFTVLELTQIFDTPEKILSYLANKGLVFGVSATAQIPSVVGNFDLGYMAERLGDNYIPMDKELEHRIKEELDKKWQAYSDGRINIHTEVMKNSDAFDIEETCRDIFANNDYAMAASNIIQNTGVEEYYQRRYCNLIKTMHAFIRNKKLQSMMYLGMALPKKNNPQMDQDVLHKIGELILKDAGEDDKEKFLFVLNGEDFDEKKELLLKKLSNGEKTYILSSYKTIGAGQNLQYEISDKTGLVELVPCLNLDDKRNFSKDIDSIYLGDITHTTVNTSTGEKIDEQSLLEMLFQVEELYYNGELNFAQAEDMMTNAFMARQGRKRFNALFNTKSVKMQVTQAVLQAIGRLCRTHIKSPEIYIYLDEKLLNSIDYGELSRRIIPPEIKVIVTLKENRMKATEDSYNPQLLNRAERVSSYGNWMIHQLLSRGWDEHSMGLWQSLRDMVLRYPTVSGDECNSNELLGRLYISGEKPLNRYLYSQYTDFSDVVIDFGMDRTRFLESGRAKIQGESSDPIVLEVSDSDARLDVMMNYSGLREFFVSHGFATRFEENEYIMSPVLYHNIYKGALGEVAGKFILENERGIRLSEITDPDKFEFFDFEMSSDVYVDFKNWKFTYAQDRQKTLEEISRKLDAIGAKRAYIINIIADDSYVPTSSVDSRIIEIPGLIDEKGMIIKDAMNKIKREDYE